MSKFLCITPELLDAAESAHISLADWDRFQEIVRKENKAGHRPLASLKALGIEPVKPLPEDEEEDPTGTVG